MSPRSLRREVRNPLLALPAGGAVVSFRRQRAKSFLVHYLEVAFTKAGAKWDSDNTAEVEELVDLIIDAAVEETTEQLEQMEHRR